MFIVKGHELRSGSFRSGMLKKPVSGRIDLALLKELKRRDLAAVFYKHYIPRCGW
jgi:hypothetical protein